MKIIKSRSSGMPMLEIVISIGIFTILSVFILQLFLAANHMQRQAIELSKAVIQAEKIAEGIKGTNTLVEAAELLELQDAGNDTYLVYFNSDWKVSENKDSYWAEAVSEIEETEYGLTTDVTISVYKQSKQNKKQIIYQLPLTSYETKR